MAKGQTCCNRIVVSGLWKYCPFCGSKLKASTSADRKVELSQQRANDELDQLVASLASAKVSELRSACKRRGIPVSGNKAELKKRLLDAGPEMVLDF